MTFKVSPGIANHRYTGCRAYFETHTRSLWVCLHLCLCHTWYLLQMPPTQGLFPPPFPPSGCVCFLPLVLSSVMACCDTPLLSSSLIFVNDHHHWPSFILSWEFATEIFVETYLWTIFVDNHHHWPWSVVKALVYLGNLPLKVCFSCKVQLPSVEPTFVQEQQQRAEIFLFILLVSPPSFSMAVFNFLIQEFRFLVN